MVLRGTVKSLKDQATQREARIYLSKLMIEVDKRIRAASQQYQQDRPIQAVEELDVAIFFLRAAIDWVPEIKKKS